MGKSRGYAVTPIASNNLVSLQVTNKMLWKSSECRMMTPNGPEKTNITRFGTRLLKRTEYSVCDEKEIDELREKEMMVSCWKILLRGNFQAWGGKKEGYGYTDTPWLHFNSL